MVMEGSQPSRKGRRPQKPRKDQKEPQARTRTLKLVDECQ
jgi:hypothetical protein